HNQNSQNNLNINNKVKLTSGFLEESNVNANKNMIDMISNAREFEMQMKIISTFDKNEEYANQLLDVNN
ncbi:MAG: flagellar basal body rod C-terminal domain-containing protein, partial [Buchnera aphidicola]|nr:flagellar basal body rod C-terminal domain-containing protein [Buchnera aphidicola]